MGFDRKQVNRGGFEVVVWKEDDYHTNPDEFDCYDEADKEAWDNGQWRFVTVVAKAFLGGVELGEAALGGCEDGDMPGARTEGNTSGYVDAYVHTLGGGDCYDVPGDAVDEAKQQLVRLLAAAVNIDLKEVSR